jgi:hypothetical protein
MHEIGKLLIVIGLLTAAIGGALLLVGRIPWLGRLPGDVVVHRGPVTFYFPIVTSIIVSVVLSLLFGLFRR